MEYLFFSTSHFNPLPPHGGRHHHLATIRVTSDISIHSLRMEGDYISRTRCAAATTISIHSLRMEGDKHKSFLTAGNGLFQSTPSAWRETFVACNCTFAYHYFNPLPPHGGRHISVFMIRLWNNFNPLPPHGGRRNGRRSTGQGGQPISIHSLRMEGDQVTQK